MNDLILSPVPVDELVNLIREAVLTDIKKELKNDFDDKLISFDQACQLFDPKVSRPTLQAWVNKDLIPMQRIGGRLYFKQSDVLNAGLKKYKNK